MAKTRRRTKQNGNKSSNRKPNHKAKKTAVLWVAILGTAAGAVLWLTGTFDRTQEAVASVTVYKSPTCGCCAEWVDHLEDNGFEVEVRNHSDVTPYKREFGVPNRLYSCHTAVVDGYIIEGHVPADDIKRLLREKHKVTGIGVPGMPHGSPGMETGRVEPYRVFSFDKDQRTRTFARY